MAIVRLTDLLISKLQNARQYTVWDASFPTFGVRIGRRTKTFVLKQHNRYYPIGRYPVVPLKQAREEARRRLALQYFPHAKVATTTAIEQFLDAQKTRIRPASLSIFQYHLNEHFPSLPLQNLTSRDINAAIAAFSPSKANKAFMSFRAFLNWCVEQQYLDRNPIAGAKQPHKTASRDRVLSDDETRAILRNSPLDDTFGRCVHFLAFSAQRRTQVGSMERSYVDFKERTITWPPHAMKASSTSHTIPLTPHLAKILHKSPMGRWPFIEGEKPFSHWDRAKKELDARVKLPHWTLHDLRRTARTNLARLGIAENIAERILAHASPKMNSVYNKYLYLPPMQDALLKLEEHYMTLLR